MTSFVADAVARLQPAREAQRRAQLLGAAEDLGVGVADVLDADRAVVEPDRVAADVPEADELVDRAVLVDDEVRAHAGPLVQLDVGRVGGERVPGRGERRGDRVVLDDHLRLEAVGARAVVALGVRAGLGAAFGAEGDAAPDDVRARGGRGGRGGRRPPAPRARAGGPRRRSAGRRAARPRTRWCRGTCGSASRWRCRGSAGAAARAGRRGARRRGPPAGRRRRTGSPAACAGGTRPSPPDAGGARAAAPRATPARRTRSGPGSRCRTRARRRPSGGRSCG